MSTLWAVRNQLRYTHRNEDQDMNCIVNARLRGRNGLFTLRWSNGLISAIELQPDARPDTATAPDTIDADGKLVIPPLVEPHIHLDAALTAGQPRWNQSGTLFEGIECWGERKALVTRDDTKSRAHETIRMLAAHGIQHVRTHIDVTEPGLGTLQAMLDFVTDHSAKALALGDRYGLEVGRPANLVVLSASSDYELLRSQGCALVSVRHGNVIMRRIPGELTWENG